MLKTRIGLLAGAAALVIAGAAYAGGSWQTWPVIGGASYCASTVSGAGGLVGGNGQATTGSICAQTVPAGPATFSGSEVVPLDLFAPGTNNGVPTNSALGGILQLGQGATQILGNAGGSVTFAAGTEFYFVDGTEASAFTVTLPANPVEGQFAKVVCSTATAGNLTVAANAAPASTALLPTFTPGVCAAGTAFNYRYNASLNIWFRV